MRGEQPLAGRRGLGLDEEFALRDAAGVQGRGEGGERRQDHQAPRPQGARAAGDEFGDPGPDGVHRRPSVGGGPGRPVGGPSGQHECGGQEGEGGEHGAGDPDRTDRAEGAVVGEVGEQQDEQAEGDGGAGRGDRFDGVPPGGAHRGEPVAVQVELLAEAGGEQQAVVGGGADDEDRQQSLDLAVHGNHAVVGE